jgi:hypothetical protein
MPVELLVNSLTTTVTVGGTTAPSALTSQSFTVSSSAGWPAAATGVSQFRIVDAADVNTPPEIMAVTNVSGTTWTTTRGYEGAAPWAHAANWTAIPVLTTGSLANYIYVGDTKIDVRGFGAIPDSSTDNTTAITNAIAWANSEGGAVVFPPGGLSGGLYVTQPLTLPPGTVLQGVGSQGYGGTGNSANLSSLKLKTGSAGALISPNDSPAVAGYVQIFDLCLNGNAINHPLINLPDAGGFIERNWLMERVYVNPAQTTATGSGNAVYIGAYNGACVMRDCTISNADTAGYEGQAGFNGVFWYGSDGLMDHCWIASFSSAGLYVSGGASSQYLVVRGGGMFWQTYGVELGGGGVVLDAVSIDHNYGPGIYAVYGPATIQNCWFHDNSLNGSGNSAHIELAGSSQNLVVKNNQVTSGVLASYFLHDGGSGNIVDMDGNSVASGVTFVTAFTNYAGTVSAPGFPASTSAVTNTTGADVQAFITNGTAAITQVTLGTTATGMQIAANASAAIRIRNGQSIKFTYASGTPTWTWVIG